MAKATKLPSGNWNMYVYVGRDENGKKIMKSFTAPSKREVELLAAQYKAAIPKNGSMLLREAYTKYCDSRRHILSGSTMKEYARIAKSSKYPIMDMDVNEITTHDIQSAVDNMSRAHSPKTVRNHYGLLSSVLKTYRPDTAFHITLPKNQSQDVYIPEPDTIRRLYYLLQDSWLFVPFLLASQCGLRASEIAGLQYRHIKPDRILVHQARVASEDGEYIKGTKTKSGKREVFCSAHVIEALGKGKATDFVVKESAWKISDGWGDFMRKHPEEQYFSFHKLRHYFASHALLLGIPKKYVADMMGHKSEHMLDEIYEHVFKTAQTQFGTQLIAAGDRFFEEL